MLFKVCKTLNHTSGQQKIKTAWVKKKPKPDIAKLLKRLLGEGVTHVRSFSYRSREHIIPILLKTKQKKPRWSSDDTKSTLMDVVTDDIGNPQILDQSTNEPAVPNATVNANKIMGP